MRSEPQSFPHTLPGPLGPEAHPRALPHRRPPPLTPTGAACVPGTKCFMLITSLNLYNNTDGDLLPLSCGPDLSLTYPLLSNEETEAQTGRATCPRPPAHGASHPLNPRCLTTSCHLLLAQCHVWEPRHPGLHSYPLHFPHLLLVS